MEPIDRNGATSKEVVSWTPSFKTGDDSYQPDEITLVDKFSVNLEAMDSGRKTVKPTITSVKTDVIVDTGIYGIEHLLMQTVPKFEDHVEKCEGKLKDKKKFKQFRKCLDGQSRRYWDAAVKAKCGSDEDQQKDSKWKACMTALIRAVTKTTDSHNSKDCVLYMVQHRKKGAAEVPSENLLRRRELTELALKMEGDEPNPTENQQKKWFYNCMPQSYRDKFNDNDKLLRNMSVDDLANYFDRIHHSDTYVSDKAKQKKAAEKRKAEDNDDDGHTSGASRKSRKKQRAEQRRQQGGGGRKNDKVKPDDDCPCGNGPTHKFVMCWGNPNGKNFHPERLNGNNSQGRDYSRDRDSSRGGGRRDHRRDDRQRGNDAHYHDSYYNGGSRGRSRSRSRSPARRPSGSRSRSRDDRDRSDGYFNDYDDYHANDNRRPRADASMFDDNGRRQR